jgi:hypothetical protein
MEAAIKHNRSLYSVDRPHPEQQFRTFAAGFGNAAGAVEPWLKRAQTDVIYTF